MDSSHEWPQISGQQPGQDFSFQKGNPQFDKMEQPIQILEFAKQDGPKPIKNITQEFKTIRILTEEARHLTNCAGSEPQFVKHNRYTDMLPFYHTLVQTTEKPTQPTPQTYINGNYISTIFNQEKAFIATQGPVQEGWNQFWDMVWNNNVQLIVMLCQLQDQRGVQCSKYWPDNQEQYLNYSVKNVERSDIGNKIIRTTLEMSLGESMKKVTHLQWLGWPDFGVPQEESLPGMDQIIGEMKNKILDKTRVVVHCSAGVGRTGTLITCYQTKTLLDFYENYIAGQIQAGQPKEKGISFEKNQVLADPKLSLSLFSIVRRQREQRLCLVMNKEQYEFVYMYAIEKVLALLKKF